MSSTPFALLTLLADAACFRLRQATASQTARLGFLEEHHLAERLNQDKTLGEQLGQFTGQQLGHFQKISGVGKTDLADAHHRIQNKKTKPGQWQQADRHPLDYYLQHLPAWGTIETPLREAFEAPLVEGRPDKTQLKPLSSQHHAPGQLDEIIRVLDGSRDDFLRLCLLGPTAPYPNLICVSTPDKLRFYHYQDLITHLSSQTWQWTNTQGKSVTLGNILRLKRYGGSANGNLAMANHVQVHICPTNLGDLRHLEVTR